VARPDAGQTISLQLDLDLQLVGLGAVHPLLLLLDPRKNSQRILHVMTDLVGDHIGLREFAGFAFAAAETGLDLAEERGVQIDLLVSRTIEGPHRALRPPAARRLGLALVEDEHGLAIGLAVPLEDVGPFGVNVAEDGRDEFSDVIAWVAGAPRLPARRLHWLLNVCAAAGKDLGAADQEARIDAQRPADQAQHHDGADPEPAAAQRQAEAPAAKSATRFATAILNIFALFGVIQTHCRAPSPGFLAPRLAARCPPGKFCRAARSSLCHSTNLESSEPLNRPKYGDAALVLPVRRSLPSAAGSEG